MLRTEISKTTIPFENEMLNTKCLKTTRVILAPSALPPPAFARSICFRAGSFSNATATPTVYISVFFLFYAVLFKIAKTGPGKRVNWASARRGVEYSSERVVAHFVFLNTSGHGRGYSKTGLLKPDTKTRLCVQNWRVLCTKLKRKPVHRES